MTNFKFAPGDLVAILAFKEDGTPCRPRYLVLEHVQARKLASGMTQPPLYRVYDFRKGCKVRFQRSLLEKFALLQKLE